MIQGQFDCEYGSLECGGAAGGLAAGLAVFAYAALTPGMELFAEFTKLRQRVERSALVITGEGRTDRSSAFGKTPVGVAAVAKKLGVPVVAISGSIGEGAEAVLDCGIEAYFSIMSSPMSLEQAFAEAPDLIRKTASQLTRLFAL